MRQRTIVVGLVALVMGGAAAARADVVGPADCEPGWESVGGHAPYCAPVACTSDDACIEHTPCREVARCWEERETHELCVDGACAEGQECRIGRECVFGRRGQEVAEREHELERVREAEEPPAPSATCGCASGRGRSGLLGVALLLGAAMGRARSRPRGRPRSRESALRRAERFSAASERP